MNFSLATFRNKGPETALAALDRMPGAQRNGDYFLLRAQVLDAMGKAQGAAAALNQGMRAAPTRADLYFSAALFLIKHEQLGQVQSLLQQAIRAVPDSPQLLLTQAIALGLAKQFDPSQAILRQIETRWPEWAQAYLIHGITLVGQAKSEAAKPLLETAIELGSRDPLAYYNLALANMESYPADVPAAEKAINKALELNPNDAYTQSLAGRIAYTQNDYPTALQHLTEAVRLWPDMVEAHQTLSGTYRALGDKEKSVAELKEVLRIKQQIR